MRICDLSSYLGSSDLALLICCQASAPSWLACPSSMSMSWLRPVTGAWVQPAAMPAVIRKTPRQLAKRDMVRFPRRDADRGPRTSHLRPTCGTAGDHGSSRAGMPFLCSAVSGGTSWKRSEEHTSELQSLMRISYAVFCLKKKKHTKITTI